MQNPKFSIYDVEPPYNEWYNLTCEATASGPGEPFTEKDCSDFKEICYRETCFVFRVHTLLALWTRVSCLKSSIK